jgi:hypothetical protein
MSKFLTGLGVTAVALIATAAYVRGDDKVAPDKLPKAITDAIKKAYPDAEIVSAEKGEEDGKPIFEVVIKYKKESIEVTLSPEGKILSAEKSIELKDVPKAVMEALEKKYPKATVKTAEELTKDGKVMYELVIVTADKKDLEVTFEKDGKFVDEEKVEKKPADGEEKLDLDKVPKAVMDAVKKKFPDCKVTGASKEKDGDKTVIEVAFTFKDHKYEVECTEDGKFIAIDKQLDAKELPKEILKTLEEKYPKAKYDMIEEVTKDDKIAEYEVELTTADGKKVEVILDTKGKVTKEEKKEEKKPEPKDKKDK